MPLTGSPTRREKHSHSISARRGDETTIQNGKTTPPQPCSRLGSEATAVDELECVPSRLAPWSPADGWSGWLSEDVSTASLIPVLLVQAFGVGLLDAATYLDYLTFSSNQTGTTALLLISATSHIPQSALLVGISLLGYVLGAGVFGQLGNLTSSARRRIFLLTCNLAHLALMAVAIILNSPVGPGSTRDGGQHRWLPLFLYAVMSGGQVAAARQSGCAEITVGPITSTWADLIIDPDLLRRVHDPRAGPRNRRAAYIVSLATGAGLGGLLYQSGGGWAVGIMVLMIKLVAMCLLAVGRGESNLADA